MPEYEEWREGRNNRGWTIKYYKARWQRSWLAGCPSCCLAAWMARCPAYTVLSA